MAVSETHVANHWFLSSPLLVSVPSAVLVLVPGVAQDPFATPVPVVPASNTKTLRNHTQTVKHIFQGVDQDVGVCILLIK